MLEKKNSRVKLAKSFFKELIFLLWFYPDMHLQCYMKIFFLHAKHTQCNTHTYIHRGICLLWTLGREDHLDKNNQLINVSKEYKNWNIYIHCHRQVYIIKKHPADF